MKKLLVTLLGVLLAAMSVAAQKLTLNDLTNLCNQKNWGGVNQILQEKGWEYEETTKGDSDKEKVIVWSYEKNNYTGNALGWFNLFVYDENLGGIGYSVYNKESYLEIQKQLVSFGFKLTDSETEKDNVIISTYKNSFWILRIRKELRGGYKELPQYDISLTKKGGAYDSDNGKKTEYGYGWYEEYTLKDGKKQGGYKIYYSSGQLKETGTYLNGKKNGKVVSYYENGNVMLDCICKNGVKNGFAKQYHKNGKLDFSGSLLNDELNGLCKWYNEDGNLLSSTTYVNGKAGKGLLIDYDENGRKTGEVNMQGDVLDGEAKIYFESGKLKMKMNYKMGKLHGQKTSYDENGRVVETCNYVDDLKEGRMTHYIYEDDNLLKRTESDFKNGQQNGLNLEYTYRNGKAILTSKINYKDGKIHGEAIVLFDDGTTAFCNYENGLLNGKYKEYRLDPERSVTDTAGMSARLLAEGEYSNDERTGYWKNYSYTSSGEPILKLEGSFSYGKKIGEWKEYWTEEDKAQNISEYIGKLWRVENYKNNELDGVCTTYSWLQNDVIEPVYSREEYRYGKLNGVTEIRDTIGGELIWKGHYIDGKKSGFAVERPISLGVADFKFYIGYARGYYAYGKKHGTWAYYAEEPDWDEPLSQSNLTWTYDNYYADQINSISLKTDSVAYRYDFSEYSSSYNRYDVKKKEYVKDKCRCLRTVTQADTVVTAEYDILVVDMIDNPVMFTKIFDGGVYEYKEGNLGEKSDVAVLNGKLTISVDGKLLRSFYVKDEKIHGEENLYDYKNDVLTTINHDAETTYFFVLSKNELYTGSYTHRFWDDDDVYEESIENGLRDGKVKCYDSERRLKWVCSYKEGLLNGKSVFYKNGEKTETKKYVKGVLL